VTPAGAAIRAERLSVVLGGATVLDDVSLDVEEGGFSVVLGPNGSGKTTLIRTLYRAIDPSAGTVEVFGRRIDAVPRRELARTLAVLRQEPELEFEFVVEELVMIGRSPHKGLFDGNGPEDRAIVREALELTDAAHLAGRLFSTLSGGEKQRVLLARALAQRPRILLLDEPTNHLDVQHQLDILARVKGLGLTVVAALHDLALADAFATDVVILDRGRIFARGAPRDVLTPERIARVFGVTAERVGSGERSVIAVLGLSRV
jgi:iron complex transport system ATP-binding protein